MTSLRPRPGPYKTSRERKAKLLQFQNEVRSGAADPTTAFRYDIMPARESFAYTFAALAQVIERFTEVIGLARFSLYVFDYGAPTGFRLAVRQPERIASIISQNGNAYEEGLSEGWSPIRAYWQDPSQANRTVLRSFLSPETTVWQYTHGVPDASLISPDGYTLDNHYLARPGADGVQLDLFGDYRTNVAMCPTIIARPISFSEAGRLRERTDTARRRFTSCTPRQA